MDVVPCCCQLILAKLKMHPVLVDNFFWYTASNVSWMWLLRHNRVRATISAPLLQNAQYATQVRKVSAHTRNRQTGRGKYGLILHSSTVQGNMAKFPGRRVIWFDMAAITLKTKEQAKYSPFYIGKFLLSPVLSVGLRGALAPPIVRDYP